MACALLLWLLGAIMFRWVADHMAGILPGLKVSADWKRQPRAAIVMVCAFWWLLVLWQLADEARKRWH